MEEGLPDVYGGDAQCGKRDGQRRAAYGYLTRRHRLDGILSLGGRCGHLIEVRSAGEGNSVDGRHLRGVRTIDGYKDDAAGRGAVQARVNNNIFDAARS